jgi:hypothetical protein
MEGILPSEIQWRRDKLPYNPDFARRGMNSKARLYELMNADKSKQFFNAYFDRGIIEKHFDDIKPFAGFSSQTSVTGIRIIQAGIACSVLSYLNGAFYRFDGCK